MDLSYGNYGFRANQIFNNKELKKKEEEVKEEQENPVIKGGEYEPVTANGAEILAKQVAAGIKGPEGGRGTQGVSGEEGGFLEFLLNLWNLYQELKQAFIDHFNNSTQIEHVSGLSNLLDKIDEIQNNEYYNLLNSSIQQALESDKTQYQNEINSMGMTQGDDIINKILEYDQLSNQLDAMNPNDPGYKTLLQECVSHLNTIMTDDEYKTLEASFQNEINSEYINKVNELLNSLNVHPNMRAYIIAYENAKIQYYQENAQNASDPNRRLRNVIEKFVELSSASGYMQLPASLRDRFESEYLEFSRQLDSNDRRMADGFVTNQLVNNFPEEIYRMISEFSSDPDTPSVYSFAFQNLGMGQRLSYFRSKVAKNQSVMNALLTITDPHYAGAVNQLRAKFNNLLTLSQNYLNQSGPSHKVEWDDENTQSAR